MNARVCRGFQRPPFPSQMPQNSNLEVIIENMLMEQQKEDEYIKQLGSKVDMLTTHNKMIEVQIVQNATFSSTPPDRSPSKPKLNSRQQCSAMLLGGGKQLELPKEITSDRSLHDKNEHVEKEISLPSKKIIYKVAYKPNEVPNDPKIASPKPYTTPLLLHQRMAKGKLDMQFEKFLDVLKKLFINILVTKALTQIPSYAKFLKEILSNKKKLEVYETIALTKECSAGDSK